MIGLMTFHRATNYGAVLQAYAMQKVLTEAGYDNEVIDYRCQGVEYETRIYVGGNKDTGLLNHLIGVLKGIIYVPVHVRRNMAFSTFRKRHIKQSRRVYRHKEDLSSAEKEYELFISGSDQVWNIGCTKGDTSYYLDFVSNKSKKNAYSASFGTSTLSILNTFPIAQLQSFSRISVREKNALEFLRNYGLLEVKHTLDPTLLLDQDSWLVICGKKRNKDRYILLYLIAETKEIVSFANKFAEEKGMKIIYITNILTHRVHGIYKRAVSPEEWLRLFIQAEYVITNSFHGLAFSINFNKQTFWDLLPTPSVVNDRLISITNEFHIEGRQISAKNFDTNCDIDWVGVNEILKVKRNESIEYINSVVEKI